MRFRILGPAPVRALGDFCILTLLVACGSDDSSPSDPGTAPTAAFTADPTSGEVPLSVAFSDRSTGAPTSWTWDFGDGGNSTEQNPTHVFTSAEDHTVALSVSNARGSDTMTRAAHVRVTPAAGPSPVPDRILPLGAGVGMDVTLHGQHFGDNAGGTDVVSFGTVTATASSWTDSAVQVVVPTFDPPAAETAAVTIQVGGRTSNAVTFYRQADGVIRLTHSDAYEWQPYWGDDSTLYFASNATGNFNIWYMDAGGGDAVQRTFFGTGHADMPAYSVPNLYYRSNHDGGTIWNIYGHGSSGFDQISDGHADFHPTFSPNGQRVAYMYKFGDWDPGRIMVVSVHGGDSTPITDAEHNCAYPTWNPVHDTIAYTRSAGGGRNIFMCDPDGTDEVQLTFFRHDVVYPHWSPDGTRLAYAAFVGGSYELFLIDVKDVVTGP